MLFFPARSGTASFPREIEARDSRFQMSRDVKLRLGADSILMAGALLLGFMVHLLWRIDVEDGTIIRHFGLGSLLQTYAASVLLLLPIGLMMFILNGIYAKGRAYRVRDKAFVLARAVTLAYLLFGAIAVAASGLLPINLGALAIAWAFTLAFTVAARVWSDQWTALLRIEESTVTRHPDAPIKNVLVIGGAGYIGSALMPKLLSKGYRVRLLDILMFGKEPIEGVLGHPNLEVVEADLRDTDKVVQKMRGVDAVIHLGAIVGDPACAFDEDLTTEINLEATRMIAEVAKGSGVRRFIFASTCSVYGASDETLDERSALNPVSLYARSKIASEKVLRSLSDHRFAPVILRFATVYGLSGRTRFDLVINLLAAKGLVDRVITIMGGDQWRPFVHVDDVASAVLAALEAPEALVGDEVFNVGSNEQNHTIDEIGQIVHRMIPSAKLLSLGADGDKRNYRVDFSKIRTVLGFKPAWTIERGIQQVIDAIETGKVTDYQDPKYSNLKSLSESDTQLLRPAQKAWAAELLEDTTPVLVRA